MPAGRKPRGKNEGCLKQCIILKQYRENLTTRNLCIQLYCRRACSLCSSCVWQVAIKEKGLNQRWYIYIHITNIITLYLHPVSGLWKYRQQWIELNILIYPALSLVKMGKPRQRCPATSLRWGKISMLSHQGWEGDIIHVQGCQS